MRYPPDPRPRVFWQRRLNYPMKFSQGDREYDLQAGDWVLVFEDGRVAGWTEAQSQAAVRWAQSGGEIPPPKVI